jgi:uncharacterized membrane protein
MNRCTVCGREVESTHHSGKKVENARGWKWMTNDAVNAISSIVGGAIALLCGMMF